MFSCTDFKKNHSYETTLDSNIARGKVLAATYCKSCHLLPDPSLLDSKNWEEGVLPGMAPRFGIFFYGFKTYPSSRYEFNLPKNFYPEKPIINLQEWQYIIDYYTALSPDSLPQQQRKYAVQSNSSLFEIEKPAFKKPLPTPSYVKIDTELSYRQLIISDMITKNMFRFNNNLQFLDSFQNISPVVDIERNNNALITCNIGELNPMTKEKVVAFCFQQV